MKITAYLLIPTLVLSTVTTFSQRTRHKSPAIKLIVNPISSHTSFKPLTSSTQQMAFALAGKVAPTDTSRSTKSRPIAPTAPTTQVAKASVNAPSPLSANSVHPVQVATPTLIGNLQSKPYLLPLDKASIRGSYPLGISATKTTHIIFPARIREFDAGTDYVLAQVPESVGNVLRVKANDKSVFCAPGSTVETNMTVMTDDGGFYSFLVRHQADPEVLNINIANNLLADEHSAQTQGINRASAVPFILPAKATGSAESAMPTAEEISHLSQRIHDRKGFIKRVGTTKMQISNHLTGLYVDGNVMYLQLALRNDSEIDYEMDFVKFYLRDRDVLKRMTAQEVELKPITSYPTDIQTMKANTDYTAVYALPLRTFSEDKVLEIELYERNGGRHLRFRVESEVLLKSRGL